MTTPRTIDSHGGVFTDEEPVMNPTTEQSAAFGTRQMEDTAQMTMTTDKTRVRFPTIAAAAPQTPVASSGRSHMGDDGAALPTVAKVSTGRYAVTYPPSWTDGLSESENIAFTFSRGCVVSLVTAGVVQCTETANVVNVAVFDMAGVLSDLGGAITIQVEAS